MKAIKLVLIGTVLLLLVSCGGGEGASVNMVATYVAQTAAAGQAAPTEPPTNTPLPSDTPLPTDTPTEAATNTPEPTATVQIVTVSQLDSFLQSHGYTRSPFKGIGQYTDLRPGKTGYSYSSDNWMETIKVYDDGYVRIEVFNNEDSRAERMERKLKMLDELFPEAFMAELRAANEAYLATVGASVSGTANQIWPPPPQDFWKSLEGQYNVSSSTIGGYEVTFSLWFWQVKCPQGYICWFPSFGNQVFRGDTSFVFYDIALQIAP